VAPEYPAVRVKAASVGLGDNIRCGDWPYVGTHCAACGLTNNG